MSVTSVSNPTFQSPLDLQEPLKGEQASKTYNYNRRFVTPIILGITGGIAIGAMILVAGAVAITVACILCPPAAFPIVAIVGLEIAIIFGIPGVIIGTMFGGVGIGALSDLKSQNIITDLSDADTPEKVAEVAARIGNDQDLSHLAKEMNFRQLTVLKAGIGLKRFGKVISQIREETPAVEAWKKIMQFHENPNREVLVQELHELKLDKSFEVINALREVYPETDAMIEMDVPWYQSEKDEALPRRVLFTHKNESIEIPLSGPQATLYKDSLTDAVMGLRFSQNKPVEIASVIDFNEFERLAAFAMGEIESVSVHEFIYLVKAAHKLSQVELLKKLDLIYKHQPILSPEDVEELSEIPEMSNLKTLKKEAS